MWWQSPHTPFSVPVTKLSEANILNKAIGKAVSRMKRRNKKKHNCALCILGVLLVIGGAVWLCFLSYRFLFILLAVLLIAAGILLKKNC